MLALSVESEKSHNLGPWGGSLLHPFDALDVYRFSPEAGICRPPSRGSAQLGRDTRARPGPRPSIASTNRPNPRPARRIGLGLLDRHWLDAIFLGTETRGAYLAGPTLPAGHAPPTSAASSFAQRLGDDPFDQFAVADALLPGLFRHQAQRGHARLGVDLEQIDPGLSLLVVPAEIGPRAPLQPSRRCAPRPCPSFLLGRLLPALGRAHMLGQAVGIFSVEVVEPALLFIR